MLKHTFFLLKNSFFRALIILGIGIALVVQPDKVPNFVIQCLGLFFLFPGLITVFSSFLRKNKDVAFPIIPVIVGSGSLLMGLVLLIFPTFFTDYLLFLFAALLLLGSGTQLFQLFKLSRKGVGIIYFIFPLTIFIVGLYLLINPMEEAKTSSLVVGYAAILFCVVELLIYICGWRVNRATQSTESVDKVAQKDELLTDDKKQLTTSDKTQEFQSAEEVK